MILDDASSIRQVLSGFFGSEGYLVVAQLALSQGLLGAIEHYQPDILCLDLNLPDSNSLDLLRGIHSAYPQLSVVMISGDPHPELEAQAAEAGAAGFLRKPFTLDQIGREVRQILQTRALLQLHGRPDSPAATPRAKAVVADDSLTLRALLVAILRSMGIEVVAEAATGRAAVELTQTHQPDLVCLDIEMPELNGLDALRQIRSRNPAVQALIITGHSKREDVLQAARSGARGYILKPFSPEQIGAMISKLFH